MIVATYFGVEALFRDSIDYAGLFPPAGLDPALTLTNYLQYLDGPDAFALKRLVWPAAKLPALASQLGNPAAWTISALVTTLADFEEVLKWNSHRHGPKVEALEVPWAVAREGRSWLEQWNYNLYLEVAPPQLVELEKHLAEWAPGRVGLKMRTGGLNQQAFPDCSEVYDFVRFCLAHQRAYKFTAGLHHLQTAKYPLNYQADSDRAQMFGVAQLFLACCYLHRCSALQSTRPDALLGDFQDASQKASLVAAQNAPDCAADCAPRSAQGVAPVPELAFHAMPQSASGPQAALDGQEDSARAVFAAQLEPGALDQWEWSPSGVSWQGQSLSLDDIRQARRVGCHSFGSCSFIEPIEEMYQRGWLQ